MFKEVNPPEPRGGKQPNKINGLGDRVERVAQPIAKTIDRVFKTKVSECEGCKARKEWLNEKFPKQEQLKTKA